MHIRNLIREWERAGVRTLTVESCCVQLPLHDAARLAALAEMYPLKSRAEIITELLSAALDQVEAAFPYVQGSRVIAEDEQGDPIYEDAGLTPLFLRLSKRHAARLAEESGPAKDGA